MGSFRVAACDSEIFGNKPAVEVDAIREAVARIRADIVDINFRGYGFFPTPTAGPAFSGWELMPIRD